MATGGTEVEGAVRSTTPPPPPISSISPPPPYEQALQHRTIEYTPYGIQHGGAYPGPPVLPGTSRPDSREDWGHDSIQNGLGLKNGDWCTELCLPAMHLCMAVTCLVLNLLIPGTGTMLSGFGVLCCVRQSEWTVPRQCASLCLCLALGLAQLVLTPFMLMGWVWSVLWGFALVGRSQQNYHGPEGQDESVQRADDVEQDTASNAPPPYESPPTERHAHDLQQLIPVRHTPPRHHTPPTDSNPAHSNTNRVHSNHSPSSVQCRPPSSSRSERVSTPITHTQQCDNGLTDVSV